MYCYGDFERNLEEKTGHDIADFFSAECFPEPNGECEEESSESEEEGE